MKNKVRHNGAVFLIVIFAIALFTTITVGILVMTTEELQLMQNQLYAAQAMCTAEAGLNDAFAQIRADSSWMPDAGYINKSFSGYGTYTVTYEGSPPDPNIICTGVSAEGYTARVKAKVTIGAASPYIIRIDDFRINE
jgi:Tfp pilus assembly protein PilX